MNTTVSFLQELDGKYFHPRVEKQKGEKLFKNIFEFEIGSVPKSSFKKSVFHLLESYVENITPLLYTLSVEDCIQSLKEEKGEDFIPILSFHDYFESFSPKSTLSPGFYLVEKRGVPQRREFRPLSIQDEGETSVQMLCTKKDIKFLLKTQQISKNQIKHFLRPSQMMRFSTFRESVLKMCEKFGNDILMNFMSFLKKKYYYANSDTYTPRYLITCWLYLALLFLKQKQKQEPGLLFFPEFVPPNGASRLRRVPAIRPQSESSIVYGVAGSGKTTKLVEKARECISNYQETMVVSFTNSAVYVLKKKFKDYRPKGPGRRPYSPLDERKEAHVEEFENIRTIDSFLMSGKNLDMFETLDVIFIDEFSMINHSHLTKFYAAHLAYPDLKFHFYGDKNQCPAIESDDLFFEQFFESRSVEEMCPTRTKCDYIPASARYDSELFQRLENVLTTSSVDFREFKSRKNILYANICFKNKTRKKINRICCTKWIEEKRPPKLSQISFHYQGEKEEYQIAPGMPLICTQTIDLEKMYEKLGVDLEMWPYEYEHKFGTVEVLFNNQQFIFTKMVEAEFPNCTKACVLLLIKEPGLSNKKVLVTNKIFSRCFILGFAATIHKYQGNTIRTPFAIYDSDISPYSPFRMSKEIIYTALSRATSFGNIFLDNTIGIERTIHFESSSKLYQKQRLVHIVKKKRIDIYLVKVKLKLRLCYRINFSESLDKFKKKHFKYQNMEWMHVGRTLYFNSPEIYAIVIYYRALVENKTKTTLTPDPKLRKLLDKENEEMYSI